MNYKHLYEQINEEREEKGFNATNLCRKADLSQSAWINLKKPKKGINTETLSKFAKVLGIDEIILKMK